MTLDSITLEKDQRIILLLKLKSIKHYISGTDKGEIELELKKGESHYEWLLDSVPLTDKETTDELDRLYKNASVSGIKTPAYNQITIDPSKVSHT